MHTFSQETYSFCMFRLRLITYQLHITILCDMYVYCASLISNTYSWLNVNIYMPSASLHLLALQKKKKKNA